jgi:hypothetical protein
MEESVSFAPNFEPIRISECAEPVPHDLEHGSSDETNDENTERKEKD